MHFPSILELFLKVVLGNGTIFNKLIEDNVTHIEHLAYIFVIFAVLKIITVFFDR
jgi:hypothetical protein